jgi:hypothetical protein
MVTLILFCEEDGYNSNYGLAGASVIESEEEAIQYVIDHYAEYEDFTLWKIEGKNIDQIFGLGKSNNGRYISKHPALREALINNGLFDEKLDVPKR